MSAEAARSAYACVLHAFLHEVPSLVADMALPINVLRLTITMRLLIADVKRVATEWTPGAEAAVLCFIHCLGSGTAGSAGSLMLRVVAAAACANPGILAPTVIPCCADVFVRAVQSASALLPVLHTLDDLIRVPQMEAGVAAVLLAGDGLTKLVKLVEYEDESVARAAVRVLAVLALKEPAALVIVTRGGVMGIVTLLNGSLTRIRTLEDAMYAVHALARSARAYAHVFVAAGCAPLCERLLGSCASTPTVLVLAALVMRYVCLGVPPTPTLLQTVAQLAQPWNTEAGVQAVAAALLHFLTPQEDTAARSALVAVSAISHPFDAPASSPPCVICMSDDVHAWSLLPCCHMFHEACINGWIVGAKRVTCPTCQFRCCT